MFPWIPFRRKFGIHGISRRSPDHQPAVRSPVPGKTGAAGLTKIADIYPRKGILLSFIGGFIEYCDSLWILYVFMI